MKNMKVKNKLILFSGIMLALIIWTAGVGMIVANLTNKARSERFNTYGRGELYLCEAFSNFHEVKVHLRNMLFLYDENDLDGRQQEMMVIREKVEEASQNFSAYYDMIGSYDQEIVDNFEKCLVHVNAYKDYVENAIVLVNNGELETAIQELLTTGLQTATDAETLLREIIKQMDEDSEAADQNIEFQVDALFVGMVAICVLSIIIAVIYCSILTRSITGPIAKLSVASKKLAYGDVEVDCTKTSEDDLGALLDDFAHMAGNIKDIDSQIATAQTNLNAAKEAEAAANCPPPTSCDPIGFQVMEDGQEVQYDFFVDKDGDGEPDINIDKDGDGEPDINIDKDGDGEPDINIDKDKDGEPDINIDKDKDGEADEQTDQLQDG